MTPDRPSLSALFRRLLGDPEYMESIQVTSKAPDKPPPGWKINNPNWPSGDGEYLIPDDEEPT